MLLKPAAALPRGEQWRYELKFDGFRGVAIKGGETVRVFSRNGRDLSRRFSRIVEAVRRLRVDSAIIDGEIVCLDCDGRPCFEDLQVFGPNLDANLFLYAFDLLSLNGKELLREPLETRKILLRRLIPKSGPLRMSDFIETEPDLLIDFAKENRLEGIVAKRADSYYEPGKRSGAWTKFKTYQEAEFLVGGFLPTTGGIESLAIGFFRGDAFRYSARVEVYLKGKSLAELSDKLLKQQRISCSFERVPNKRRGDTWSVGLTKEDFERFVWINPNLPVRIRFTQWSRSGLLRHAGLIGLS
jgi:bifunctional non-homologous end joining protein LigD